MPTGWWGEPGGPLSKSTKVHFVQHGKRHPICWARIGSRMEFQWCAKGFEFIYVECATCRKLAKAALR